jgi:hypothetical protein
MRQWSKSTRRHLHVRTKRLVPPRTERQRLVRHLHDAGPRPVLEALLAVANGGDLDEVLADIARLPVSIYHAMGANELPIDRVLQ